MLEWIFSAVSFLTAKKQFVTGTHTLASFKTSRKFVMLMPVHGENCFHGFFFFTRHRWKNALYNVCNFRNTFKMTTVLSTRTWCTLGGALLLSLVHVWWREAHSITAAHTFMTYGSEVNFQKGDLGGWIQREISICGRVLVTKMELVSSFVYPTSLT